MKKGVWISAALLVLLVSAPAWSATTFNFGVKAGLSLSNVSWSDDLGDEKSVLNPSFGAFALINVTPMFGIQPEVNYLVTGEKWDSGTFGTVTEKFTYLHVPVLLRARLMKEGKVVPIVFAGPAVSFLLSAKETGEDSIKEFFKSTDFGADFGLGVEMALGTMKGLVDLRYYLGLTNNYAPPEMILSIVPMDFTMKNRALVFTIGLIF